jgi:SAM-dependent methyltransferase
MKTDNYVETIIQSYEKLYELYGVSPKSLGWTKGKQEIRFFQLTRNLNLDGKSILDVGCGFGDFAGFLIKNSVKDFKYYGIDLVPKFISDAKNIYSNSNSYIHFINDDFLKHSFDQSFDYVISSGAFNLDLKNFDGYSYVAESLSKMYELSRVAVTADFLSDKVDYCYEHNFNSDPAKILEMAYALSKRVNLLNDCFPFEFSIEIYRDDWFDGQTLFRKKQD